MSRPKTYRKGVKHCIHNHQVPRRQHLRRYFRKDIERFFQSKGLPIPKLCVNNNPYMGNRTLGAKYLFSLNFNTNSLQLNPGFLDDKKSLTMAEIGAIEPNHEIPNPTLECLGHPSLMVGELSTPFMYRIDALFDILIDRIEKQVPYQFQNYHENESCYLTYVR